MMSKNPGFHHEGSLKNSRIIRLLKSFSRSELKEAEYFLQALFSKQTIILNIFAYLRNLYPAFDTRTDDLKLVIVYESVFQEYPQAKKQIVNMQNSISDLYQHLLQYLCWQETKYQSQEGELLKLKALQKRNLKDDFLGRTKLLKKRLGKSKDRDMWFFLYRLQLNHLEYYATDLEKLNKESNFVIEAMESLDQFYATTKLKYGCELQSRNNLLQEQYDIYLIDEVIDLYQDGHLQQNKNIEIYKKFWKLIKNGEEKQFYQLKKEIASSIFQNKRELLIYWTYLMNFASKRIREGNSEYYKEAFDLYKMGVKADVFTIDGFFPTEPFLNIVNVGCTLNAYNEIRGFIEEWKNTLKPDTRESTLKLALSRLEFGLGNYSKVITLAFTVNFKNDTYNLQARLLDLRSHYELNEPKKKLRNKCDRIEQFLDKNKTLSSSYIEGCRNFLSIFKMLIKSSKSADILKEIETTPHLIAKDWLLAKI